MCSPRTGSPLVEKDDEIPENVSDDVADEEESLERNSTEENVSDDEAASDVNPLARNAAEILPMLQNLLLNNDIQRERLTGLIQLYAPIAAENTNAMVNEEGEQIPREADLSSQIHFFEQSLQMLEEEIENQKKLNALLEQMKRLTRSSDP